MIDEKINIPRETSLGLTRPIHGTGSMREYDAEEINEIEDLLMGPHGLDEYTAKVAQQQRASERAAAVGEGEGEVGIVVDPSALQRLQGLFLLLLLRYTYRGLSSAN